MDMTGQDRTGQDRTGQDRTGQDRTGQVRSGQVRSGQERAGQGRAGQGSKEGMGWREDDEERQWKVEPSPFPSSFFLDNDSWCIRWEMELAMSCPPLSTSMTSDALPIGPLPRVFSTKHQCSKNAFNEKYPYRKNDFSKKYQYSKNDFSKKYQYN
jgi:hypothetical protein